MAAARISARFNEILEMSIGIAPDRTSPPFLALELIMLQRLYVHNFRCLENFELSLKGLSSALLIGKNGSGKSTVAKVFEIFQHIGRGTNRVGNLVEPKDFAFGRTQVPIRLELEVTIESRLYQYALAFELPTHFREPRISEEKLLVEGNPIYSRQEAQVTLASASRDREVQFLVDWHLVALPVIQEQSEQDPLHIFKIWLAHLIVLAPIPPLINGASNTETLEIEKKCSNFGDWFSGLLSRYPAAYTQIDKYLRDVMPDIQDFLNEPTGKDAKNMVVRFEAGDSTLSIDFENLSDGEKCFFLCASVLAANKYYGPLFCFWDEPDNHLSLSEVGHFVTALRRSFRSGAQILATSHNEEAIRRFSDENTFFLERKSHLEPTIARLLSDLPPTTISGDLVDSLIRDEIHL